MFNYPKNIYQQSFIVFDSGFGALDLPPALVSDSDFGTGYSRIALYESTITDPVAVKADMESQITQATFSSVAVLWNFELSQDYQELGDALSEMTEIDEDNEWQIDAPVLSAACFVATELMTESFPAPKVFSHGPKSVVFNWSQDGDNLYLTISADRISALISTPERIRRRADYSLNQLMGPSDALLSIRAAYLNRPVRRLLSGAVSNPLELAL